MIRIPLPALRAALAAAALALAACSSDPEIVCAAGEQVCGGACAAVEIDSSNCGACGAACGAYQECNAGACECGPGTVECGGGCVDLSSDPASCGACGVACGTGQVCAGGVCASACPGGQRSCGGACADLSSDRWNCGACGVRCDRGESCREGACRPDVYVACFATDDVRPANAALRAGLPRAAGDGPIALGVSAGRLWAAASLSHSLVAFPLDLGAAGVETMLGGGDLEALSVSGDRLWVANAAAGSLVVYDASARRVVDEVVLGTTGVNPRWVAFANGRAYAALYGLDATSGGQEVAVIDPATGEILRRVDLRALADAPGLPFPAHAVVAGGRVFVTLANLRLGEWGYYTDPAGSGKLAVIDPAADDALSSIDLGDGCLNPGGLAASADGRMLWVACGGSAAVLPVELGDAGVTLHAPVAAPDFSAPGNIALCGRDAYVTDQWSGSVWRFDPSTGERLAAGEICPASQAGWAWAADVACAP
ncbi:conserved hypothetical protein [Anaeromyxobacter dehalogenans 2CP-1]|uniref:Uncharacterized protein n=1 Tax=Anaeromyxobacter dehalogenans (strain ATCC BAA-258 / DSM 21875 / 2CP-1) TaxID=455488 RepID=B8J649_ANAD2|nr:MXAN_6577-like cysteine-rich protein [Anaeromyxobacter dehalogenans]ACL66944.1 conserved hypothetical protein [Anaeromyxobacter dehalogenans 2CP-1]